MLVIYMSFYATNHCLFCRDRCTSFHQFQTKSSRPNRILSRFKFFLLKSCNQHLPPSLVSPSSFTWCSQKNDLIHLKTLHGTCPPVQWKPGMLFLSLWVFHLMIGGQLFPIGFAVCGLVSCDYTMPLFLG